MNILFFGDVIGRSGRDGLEKHLPALKERFAPDVVIVNAENATSGYGLTLKMAAAFFEMGIDCVTLGNHAWAQRELLSSIQLEPRIVRPMNYPKGTPGQGFFLVQKPDGRAILVVQILAQLFVQPLLENPFACIDAFLASHPLSGRCPIFVDFHGEATSEKMAMGHFLDGRVSAVIGTHTHVPTADAHILPKGTAYMTDVGMTGDYDSVIGMKKEAGLWTFTQRIPYPERRAPAEGEASVCGAFIQTDDQTGLAKAIEPVRVGGILSPR
ncbi:MAG: TIGR00282 family metallophosphoesterase [Alphaproteobacteria bacterium]|nr:TIGR00282 family metallophosphoesterase [Alphaproteobacteria bacterium]